MVHEIEQGRRGEPQVKVVVRAQRRGGKRRPIVHFMMSDGRVTEFRDRGLVVPDGDDVGRVYALLVSERGEIMFTQDGDPALVPVPVLQLGVMPDPNAPLSWREVAERAGVSLSTAKRLVSDATLPSPVKVGLRKVQFRAGDVDVALAKLRAGKRR